MPSKTEIREQVELESARRARLAVPAFAGGFLYLLSAIIIASTLSTLPTVGSSDTSQTSSRCGARFTNATLCDRTQWSPPTRVVVHLARQFRRRGTAPPILRGMNAPVK